MIVFDASAILCLVKSEPGKEIAESHIENGIINLVNWSEVMQKSAFHGYDTTNLKAELKSIGLIIEPFTEDDADVTAELFPFTKPKGLSLADRSCLATAMRLGLPVLTTEWQWNDLVFPHKPEIIIAR